MRGRLLLTLGLLCAAVRPAAAAELLLGWDADLVWNSNVLQTVNETADGESIPKEPDFSVRTGPNLQVREMQGDLTYDLSYNPRYEAFFQIDGISQFDQFASGEGRWQVDNTTEFHFENDFAFTSSLAGLVDAVPEAAGTLLITPQRERILTNNARAGSIHRLGPLWELRFDVAHDLYEYEVPGASDAFGIGGSAQLTRGITRRLVTGAGVQVQRQEFSGTEGGQEDTGTTFYQVFGVVNYRISPTWNISVNAGPALSQPDAVQQSSTFTIDRNSLRTTAARFPNSNVLVSIPVIAPGAVAPFGLLGVDPNSCPQGGDGARVLRLYPQNTSDFCTVSTSSANGSFDAPFAGDDQTSNNLTYFGRITMDKSWRNWLVAFSYQRSASNSSGLGNSTTLDLLNGQLRWTPSSLWTLSLVGTMSKQTAINEVRQIELVLEPETVFGANNQTATVGRVSEVTTGGSLDNSLDIRQYRVELRAERRITRNLVVDGSATWWEQVSQSGQLETVRNDWRFLMGVTWTFDPIPL